MNHLILTIEIPSIGIRQRGQSEAYYGGANSTTNQQSSFLFPLASCIFNGPFQWNYYLKILLSSLSQLMRFTVSGLWYFHESWEVSLFLGVAHWCDIPSTSDRTELGFDIRARVC